MSERVGPGARPSYQVTLGAIGHFFDQQQSRGIFLAEVDEGYIGKAYPAEQEAELSAEGFTFPHDDVHVLMAESFSGPEPVQTPPPFCTDGYGLFMKAFGAQCDQAQATYVSILELSNAFVVCYTAPDGKRAARRRFVLDRNAIDELVGAYVGH